MAAHRCDLKAVSDQFTVTGIRRQTRDFEILDAFDAHGHAAVIKRACGLDTLGWHRFRREIRLANCLQSDGLASVLGHGRDWLALELLKDTLRSDSAPWDEARALRVLRKIAETLAQLHANGVVHRDLKPSHILFRGHEPVIIDLGVAGLIADDPLEGVEIVGSPAWMAPEQALGAPPAPTADVWSLCAVAYWLISGRTLFAGGADSVLKARQQGDFPSPDLPPITSPGLTALLAAGLGPAKNRPGIPEFIEAINNL